MSQNYRRAIWVLIALGCISTNLYAQTSDAALLDRAKAAKENFRPLARDEVSRRRLEVQRALGELDRSLATSRSGYAAGWKAYLHWDQLTQSLASDDTADVAVLRDVFERFRRNNRGLEMPKFLQARDRLRDYLNAVQASREAKLQENYATMIDDLAKRLEQYVATPTGANGPEIGRTLSWLQNAGQAPELVSAVQDRFSQPNLVAHASARFVGAGFNERINRTQPVTDVILGTSIRGTAHFLANQSSHTIHSANDARLNILLNGTIYTNNVGYNGPVTIRNSGVTSVAAAKQLVVNADGVFAMPATSNCRTSTTIHSISAKCGLIERIAWKKAGQQKGQAEAIASSHAAARMNGFINQEAAGSVARANEQFQEKFRWPLVRRGHAPKDMNISSDANGMGVTMLQMSRDQIAAPSAPPAVPDDHDLAIQTHESFVANFSEAAIGGLELTDEMLAKMMQDATGSVPEELQITDEKTPWSITFAENFPISAAFDGNQVRLALRANRFTSGRNEDGTVDQETKGLIEISATYSIEKTEKGATLKRQGPLNVDFVGEETLGVAQIGAKKILARKFGSLFKPELVGEGLKLKGRWAKAGTLRLGDVKAEKGWIAVAWQAE
jgi:hypothetical protein